MSARSSNKADLFSARSVAGKKEEEKSPGKLSNIAESPYINQNYNTDNSPLQLEHMLGYAGNYRKTVLAISSNENLYVKG